MKNQMEVFTEEFYRCARCFIMYCEDNLNNDGCLNGLCEEKSVNINLL